WATRCCGGSRAHAGGGPDGGPAPLLDHLGGSSRRMVLDRPEPLDVSLRSWSSEGLTCQRHKPTGRRRATARHQRHVVPTGGQILIDEMHRLLDATVPDGWHGFLTGRAGPPPAVSHRIAAAP